MHVSVKLGISFQTLPSECYDNENNVSGRSREGGGKFCQAVSLFSEQNNGSFFFSVQMGLANCLLWNMREVLSVKAFNLPHEDRI